MAETGFKGFSNSYFRRSGTYPITQSSLHYWCAYHPSIANFHWDHNVWGSSWFFMVVSVVGYVFLVQFLKLALLWRKKPVPLGPIPALYSFSLLLASIFMFVGCWQSAVVEIQETRWLWQKSKTSLEWILCFPVGTRPAGRVFFWSYVFYLSKYYEFLGSFILVLQKQNLSTGHVLRKAMVVIICFLWLQFSQSLQILTLLTDTGFYVVVYFYCILCKIGLAPKWKNAISHCEIAQYILMAVASVAMVGLHFRKEGCNGMVSWFLSALIDASTLPFVLTLDPRRQASVLCPRESDDDQSSCLKIKDE